MVHAILYFTASAGLAISLALAGEDRPWALDLEATAKLLGLGVAGDPQSQKQALDEWMQTVGGPEDNPKIRQLIGMLYISCAASCALTCCTILAVSFFAPRNRPLVFTMQGILVSGLKPLYKPRKSEVAFRQGDGTLPAETMHCGSGSGILLLQVLSSLVWGWGILVSFSCGFQILGVWALVFGFILH
mmetsp:Transcript_25502/g.39988  ORF Transcript_25502/g.39988 Transcript_25502/m.39988 type:complete len:188 (-) Transcript_25502:577-1140(-)